MPEAARWSGLASNCSSCPGSGLTPERWPKGFEEAGFKDEVKPLILKENARRLPELT